MEKYAPGTSSAKPRCKLGSKLEGKNKVIEVNYILLELKWSWGTTMDTATK